MKTNFYNFRALFLALVAAVAFSSCSKDDGPGQLPEIRSGFYILNEGNLNANNASLSFYNFENESVVADFFAQKNGRGLGDTGNDIQIYGSKMYIVVNASNTVEVVNAKTVKSIKQISFVDQQKRIGRQPRYIVFNKNKAFVSAYDGTVSVIDTASLVIEKTITVGRSPEAMAIANNKLYVANSGGLDYPNYDKTVSVIDLSSLSEIKKIEVAVNPGNVTAGVNGKIYVKSTGDYGDVKPTLSIIDSKTDAVTSSKEFSGSSMTVVGNKAYFLKSGGVMEYDLLTDAVVKENIITDGTAIKIPYGFSYDNVTGEFFVCDAVSYSGSGIVYCFGKDGKKKYEVKAGALPGAVVFLNK
ncbi:YncE family protein [Pelobium manganitolerans]|uniref:YncE family protein n=1 Tax=Pelobium manganitolerans TaxID=1842495 RepID=UPI003FA3AD4C